MNFPLNRSFTTRTNPGSTHQSMNSLLGPSSLLHVFLVEQDGFETKISKPHWSCRRAPPAANMNCKISSQETDSGHPIIDIQKVVYYCIGSVHFWLPSRACCRGWYQQGHPSKFWPGRFSIDITNGGQSRSASHHHIKWSSKRRMGTCSKFLLIESDPLRNLLARSDSILINQWFHDWDPPKSPPPRSHLAADLQMPKVEEQHLAEPTGGSKAIGDWNQWQSDWFAGSSAISGSYS